MSYFPMFVELKDADCLVVGGGNVARRKVETLMDFGAQVTVLAHEVIPELREKEGVRCVTGEFTAEALEGRDMVVAASSDAALNHEIFRLCRAQKIPVNVVDKKEECSFIFPAYVKRGEVTAAVTSGGASPVLSQYLKAVIETVLPERLQFLAEAMKKARPYIRDAVCMEEKRKRVYEELLGAALSGVLRLSEKEGFEREDLDRLIGKYGL